MTATTSWNIDGVGVTLFALSIAAKRIMSYIIWNNNQDFELEQKYIDEFIRNGIVVIPKILHADEVKTSRRHFHEDLMKIGCDPNHLLQTAGTLSTISSTGGAGGILDIFYADWKLALNEHPRVVSAFITLLRATYASPTPSPLWSHPFGSFRADEVFMYIDRCCFRVPDVVSKQWKQKKKGLQRSLTPHLDCCPQRLFSSVKETPKWRPIQAFVALTDTIHPDEGGFEAAPCLHAFFDEWVAKRPPYVSQDSNGQEVVTEPPCVGDFTPIRPKEDQCILELMKHIPVRAGDLVCWDYRIGIEINRKYAEDQLARFRLGQVPVDQWHEHTEKQECSYDFSTSIGRKMMTIDSYH